MSEIKLLIIASAVTLSVFCLSLNIGRTVTLVIAMLHGYCEESRTGTMGAAWVKCR